MKFTVGRALQLVGLALVGVGLVVGLVGNDLKFEERMLFAGGGAFLAGWLLIRPFRA